MSEINNLAYFLKSMKETLPFKDDDDLGKKISESKEFRIRIQKLVYLSKFFGWNNSYHFNFHQKGPYSIELTHDYQNLNEISTPSPTSFRLNISTFKSFIENQSNDFLEATSTILYYLNKVNLENVDENILSAIMYLKPHLPKETIEKAYEKIKEYDLFNKSFSEDEQTSLTKEIVQDKLDGLTNIFENFEVCSNQTIILGSIDYFRLALKRETLEGQEKYRLLEEVYGYGESIEKFYFINYNLVDNFPYFDLTSINEKFDELQDYISNLNILPRLYDEDVDLSIFNE